MASVGHIAVGLSAARLRGRSSTATLWPSMVVLSALSMLPDLDVIGFELGVPYGAPFGHRGATHSLVAALLIAAIAALFAPSLQLSRSRTCLVVGAVVASHGLLDTLTSGGLGVALFWPFTLHRYFAPWRPIAVAPIGAGMLSRHGLQVAAIETLEFLPLFVYALWPRATRQTKNRPALR